MKREFVPYEQALELKQLGFDKSCYANYSPNFKLYHPEKNYIFNLKSTILGNSECKAPTFSQTFRWFREKYNLHHSISILQRSCRYHFKIRTIECESDLKPFGDNKIIFEDGPRKKYEDIELECLKKLIEIVKDGKK